MKKILTSLLIVVVFGLSGCGDKEAREYAAKLIPVLDSYQEQLSQKIKAEQESYKELAQAFEEARKADISVRLEFERTTRSEDLGEEIGGADESPTLLEILTPLQEYALADFEATQGLLQEELNARSKYLTGLESLEIELQKIKLLKEALQELSKSKSDFRKFKSATEFLLKTDEGINKLLCVDLKKQLDQLGADKAELKKELDQLNTDLKEDELGKDEKEEIEEQIKGVQKRMNEAEQKINVTKERMATKKCA
jgi:hypothetical protein